MAAPAPGLTSAPHAFSLDVFDDLREVGELLTGDEHAIPSHANARPKHKRSALLRRRTILGMA
jgi:hypothetical protein